MIKGVILDLDGTVYQGHEEVPGAARFINFLQETGRKFLFVTNRANRTPEEVSDQLRGFGVPCDVEHVLTSAQAAARYLRRGRVFMVGEGGLRKALEEAGLVLTDESPDYVVVSFDRDFTYGKMKTACRLIDEGARFIATNPDKGLRTEQGLVPGTGAIVASVAAGCGKEPVIIGKPEPLIVEMGVALLGLDKESVVAVGDNLATDIPAGNRAGVRTALLLTGISSREDLERSDAAPTWVVDDYEELQRIVQQDSDTES